MIEKMQLGYLVIEVTEPTAWRTFAEDLLGLGVDRPNVVDGSVLLRMDGLQQRFTLDQGPADDLTAIGLIAADTATLDITVDRIQAAGVEVDKCDDATANSRRVRQLVSFSAPDGTTVELGTAPIHDVTPYGSPLVPGGFVTGRQGLGHAVMMVDDLPTVLSFWINVLGFTVSDSSSQKTPSGTSNAYFLHCNRRHHSIALVQRPARSTYPKKLLHFMIEAASMDAVGMAYDRALDAGLTINRSLGRHPNDRMFSFYATTPSGFDFEFGWGAVEVGEDWSADHYDHISAWGHRKLPAATL